VFFEQGLQQFEQGLPVSGEPEVELRSVSAGDDEDDFFDGHGFKELVVDLENCQMLALIPCPGRLLYRTAALGRLAEVTLLAELLVQMAEPTEDIQEQLTSAAFQACLSRQMDATSNANICYSYHRSTF